LLKQIEEYGKYLEITGFENVKIKDTAEFLQTIRKRQQQNTTIQFFNAELVATWQHLYFAALNALTAFRNESNISKNLAIEILLYASAQRQIRKAIALLGVKHDSTNIAMVIISENPNSIKSLLQRVTKQINAELDETVLTLSKRKVERLCNAFNISNIELETVTKKGDTQQAIVDLVIEKMALLSTQL
jgi:tRNA threonylcarbamoyladenosine modification (KEOPS) complex Cgi121 subunit